MNANANTVLKILEHAMALAHDTIVDGPSLGKNEVLVDDICCLLGALDHLLRLYRKSLTQMNDNLPF
jgi:hypothetical protein